MQAALKPYVGLSDYGLAIGLLSVHDRLVTVMRHKWLVVFLFGWSHLQTAAALDQWLLEGVAGGNYYYFSCMVMPSQGPSQPATPS